MFGKVKQDILAKLGEPGQKRMKPAALVNHLVEVKGHPRAIQKQVKVWLANHRSNLSGMLMGISSYGGVITCIESKLRMDVCLASPTATLDTCGCIGYIADPTRGRLLVVMSTLRMAMKAIEQQVPPCTCAHIHAHTCGHLHLPALPRLTYFGSDVCMARSSDTPTG